MACEILVSHSGSNLIPCIGSTESNLWTREVSNMLSSYCQNMSRKREEVKRHTDFRGQGRGLFIRNIRILMIGKKEVSADLIVYKRWDQRTQ